jgi:hypothetical protein
MIKKRVKISSIVENQLPIFVREEFPLISEFLSQYYKSLDGQGSTYDILQNIDQYIKLENVTNLIESTRLSSAVDLFDANINVESTSGFPDNNGIIRIDDEIILYESKTESQFLNCIRGFSGVTSYTTSNKPEELTFSTSTTSNHSNESIVENLSILFLKEFFAKLKKQIIPGFENVKFYSDGELKLNENNFIINSKNFYSTKGTDTSFELLFKALYGDPATVIKPRDFVIRPSDSNYKITKNLVVESIEGDANQLYNRTLFQKQSQGLKETFGTVTKVEEIIKDNNTYYVLSLDFDYDKDISVRGSIFGDFSIHPKTKVIRNTRRNLPSIVVDSTINFPESGELIVETEFSTSVVKYNSKNINQFLECTGEIDDIDVGSNVYLNVYAYSLVNDAEIKVRILGILQDIEIPNNSRYFSNEQFIKFNTLGKLQDNFKYNDWITNIPVEHKVSKFEYLDNSKIKIYTIDTNFVTVSDQIYIVFFDIDIDDINEQPFEVESVSQDKKSIIVTNPYRISKIYSITKSVKTYVNNFGDEIISDVQNVYSDNLDNVYVTSQGIPGYVDYSIAKKNFSINLFGLLNSIEDEKIGITTQINNSIVDIDISVNSSQIHDYKTGDSVVYLQNPVTYTLDDGRTIELNVYNQLNHNQTYYVERISDSKLRLYKSRSNIYFNRYTNIEYNRLYSPINLKQESFTNNQKIQLLSNNYFLQDNDFVLLFDDDNNIEIWYYTYSLNQWEQIKVNISGQLFKSEYITNEQNKKLSGSNLIKKLSEPKIPEKLEETNFGATGILANGVEILNYKSNDFIYYGEIEKINVISPGSEYDVINLPSLQISPEITTTDPCIPYLEVTGELVKINVLDGGFDFLDEPKIKISGGNGSGAEVKANLISFKHEVNLNPTVKFVNLAENTISFSTYHKFRAYEEVIYQTNNQKAIGGISTNSVYYVSVQDDLKIKLHNTKEDALAGIAISLTSYGDGSQKLISKEEKKKISSVTVLNSGKNYKNNTVIIASSGINTYDSTITANNHGYVTGDIVKYQCTETYPVGLGEENYYVTRIDYNNFKLSNVGVGTTAKDFYFKTNQYVTISTSGIGTHTFKHEPISLEVLGKTGISSYSSNLFLPKLTPVFRGSISNVYIQNGGIGYGSSEILNYEKQPFFTINSGKNAQFLPNVVDGVIKDVYVINGGSGYTTPELVITGSGIGCILNPVVDNGVIKNVVVVNGGSGYQKNNTLVEAITFGKNSSFQAKIKSWNVNSTFRIINSNNLLSPDDGVLSPGENNNLKYSHLYYPTELRKKVFSKFLDENGNLIFRSDYENSTSNIKYHSPIVGWAYDGNPIYGPYGYSNPIKKSSIKKIISGYELLPSSKRPPQKKGDNIIFPNGFFVDDYVFTGNGDLDENNGRYCVTPEYPNGTYAYFCTVSENDDFKPEFPYIIGKYFRSKKIIENFDPKSNQNSFDYNNVLRNTYFYSLKDLNSNYKFLSTPNQDLNQTIKIKSTSYGKLNSIGIITGGQNYSVGDYVKFDNSSTNGYGANASVDYVLGKPVTTLQNNKYTLNNIEIYSQSNYYIGISTETHQLNDLDFVNIVGKLNLPESKNINDFVNVGVRSQFLTLTESVNSTSSTGIVTIFSVEGNLQFPFLLENDFYKIDDEVIKILKIDQNESKIKVLRNPTGSSHTAKSKLVELTRKFNFNLNKPFNSQTLNRQYYFNPTENVGFGTTTGSTVSINYTGIGTTSLNIPAGSFYIPNNDLDTNTPLIYSPNGGNSIKVSNGSSIFDLSNSKQIYSIKLSNDFIGISSNKVSIGTEGKYVGIGTTTTFLYVTDYGTGNYHSFKTDYPNVIKVDLQRNNIRVSTSSTHGLRVGDLISINVKSGITTTLKLEYNEANRRLTTNKKYFSSINTVDSTIEIVDHNYYNGQPIIYTSSSPSIGLENNRIYYVIVIDKDNLNLASSEYNSITSNQKINITSSSSGYLYEINPNINILRNQKIIFDLSDSSLSFNDGVQNLSAFEFDLYEDINFNKKYFNTVKFGNIGIDANARLELQVTDETPQKLYYNLKPKTNINLPKNKEQIYIDESIFDYNTINIVSSDYSGEYPIVGISSTSFDYCLRNTSETNLYSSFSSDISYYTNSKTAYGEIKSLKINSPGQYYDKLPGITSITSKTGTDAVLYSISDSIGKIKSTDILDFGYQYSIDPTVKPTLSLPRILRIEPFSSIDRVVTTFKGRFYNYSPNLIVIDSVTNQIQDTVLNFNHLNGKVTIIKNSTGFNNVKPRIIPVNNSNGIGINSITYDVPLKRATATLNYDFTDPNTFPVEINDKIIVENTSILQLDPDFVPDGTTYKGYNSSEYNYSEFNVVAFSTAINDDRAYITFSLENVANSSFELGTFDPEKSRGNIVPVKNIPIFDPIIKKNSYVIGEKVESDGKQGVVSNWDPKTNYIEIESVDSFKLNSFLVGKTSGSVGKIEETIQLDSVGKVNYYTIKNDGWKNQVGFLNVNSQRIHDSDYYQYFSYSVKSRTPFDRWESVVSSLNHTSGFKKFSDLSIESETIGGTGISTDQNNGNIVAVADLNTIIDLETTYDFDLGSEENTFTLNSELISDEITFNSTTLQDYSQSIGNRVLVIDDISGEFNTNRKSTFVTAIDI